MATRGSHISRTIQWFKEGDFEEVSYIVARGMAIVNDRQNEQKPAPKVVAKTVVHRRKRRTTSAQIMADAAASEAADAATTKALSSAAAAAAGE